MAMTLNAGEVGRQDMFSIFPENIVVVDAENSRVVPHSPEETEALARSILEYGQQQPAVVRKNRRQPCPACQRLWAWSAVTFIDSTLRPANPIKLQCKVLDLNAEEAFVRSIVENNERSSTTPIDDAHAQRRLREEFGWTDRGSASSTSGRSPTSANCGRPCNCPLQSRRKWPMAISQEFSHRPHARAREGP